MIAVEDRAVHAVQPQLADAQLRQRVAAQLQPDARRARHLRVVAHAAQQAQRDARGAARMLRQVQLRRLRRWRRSAAARRGR